MPLTLVLYVGFSMVVFTLPVWSLEAVAARCEGTSRGEVKKTEASVLSKWCYRGQERSCKEKVINLRNNY